MASRPIANSTPAAKLPWNKKEEYTSKFKKMKPQPDGFVLYKWIMIVFQFAEHYYDYGYVVWKKAEHNTDYLKYGYKHTFFL